MAFSRSLTITDLAGNPGTLNCSITVHPPVTATCVVINAVEGIAIAPVTLIGSGGPDGCLRFNLENADGAVARGLWLPLGFFGVHRVGLINPNPASPP